MGTPIYPNFLSLPPELSDPERAGALILPLPLDITASWRRGTDDGPKAIIEASHHIEYFDDEVGFDPAVAIGGIATQLEPELPTDPKTATVAVEAIASNLLRDNRLLISLGGEHSLTYPLVKAHLKKWPELCVLQIDAHADLRESYADSPYNHACPMKRLMDLGVHVTALAIRSADESEAPLLDGNLRRTFPASELVGRVTERLEEIIDSLPCENLYITIDLDGLDPSVVPAVGTPVPGGLGWFETLEILKTAIREKNLVGADVVELSPREGLHYADSAAARLVFKLIAYQAVKRGRVE
ncbi:MAG TPA: agmatinase [Acidobacteriota bacterium]|nr:agmatinase [Acidobacteriota bacterium]